MALTISILLWIAAVCMIVVGLCGTVIPVIPGLPLIFCGSWLAAWIDDYHRISVTIVIIIGVLMGLGMLIEWVSQALGAKKAGATKLGILGSIIGTIAGVFSGLWGLIFMPLLGAAIGEYIDHQDAIRSGKVGIATWFGMMIGTVIKLGLAFTMVGLLIGALLI